MLAFLFKKGVFAFVSFDVLKLTVYNVLYENVNAFRLKIYWWPCILILFLYALYPVFGWRSVLWCLFGTPCILMLAYGRPFTLMVCGTPCILIFLWDALYPDGLWDTLVCWCLFWEALYTDVLWHALYPDAL